MIKVYYIIHPDTLAMSNGAAPPAFVEKGKIWLSKDELHAHVNIVDDVYGPEVYNDCVIFEGEIKNIGMCVL